jgi:hypothetical protein
VLIGFANKPANQPPKLEHPWIFPGVQVFIPDPADPGPIDQTLPR